MTGYPSLTNRTIALDTETTGLKWWQDEIFGISISIDGGKDFYWDVRLTPKVLDWLRDNLHRAARVFGHNIKFDGLFFRKSNIHLPWARVEDTMIRAALIDEHLHSYDLDTLGLMYVGVGKDDTIYADLATTFGGRATKTVQMSNLHKANPRRVAVYAKTDTRTTLELGLWQDKEIAKQDLTQVVQLEKDLLPVVVDMEWGGVHVDVRRAEQAVGVVGKDIVQIMGEIDGIAGFPVNPNPSGSIHKLFAPVQSADGIWRSSDGTICESTPAGKPSLDKDFLRRSRHPAASAILEVRQLLRMRDTFLLGHVLGHQTNGIIHCNFNQTKGDNDLGAGTGRFSVDSPALQQIPKRNKVIAKVVRSIFIPDDPKNDTWIRSDYRQFEFRWFAHFAKNPKILKAYADDPDTDMHTLVSKMMPGLPRDATPGIKGNAKQINLGLVFGMGDGRMAQEMGLPHTIQVNPRTGKEYIKPGPEAEALFRRYHETIPGIKTFLEAASATAKERGYIKTIYNRHIRFPNGWFTHKAGGLILQGSAADALKIKMIETHALEGASAVRMLLSVHDELDWSAYRGSADVVKEDLQQILEAFGPGDKISLRVPVRAEMTDADNWWEASK
jgi:DNA polymerase I